MKVHCHHDLYDQKHNGDQSENDLDIGSVDADQLGLVRPLLGARLKVGEEPDSEVHLQDSLHSGWQNSIQLRTRILELGTAARFQDIKIQPIIEKKMI